MALDPYETVYTEVWKFNLFHANQNSELLNRILVYLDLAFHILGPKIMALIITPFTKPSWELLQSMSINLDRSCLFYEHISLSKSEFQVT